MKFFENLITSKKFSSSTNLRLQLPLNEVTKISPIIGFQFSFANQLYLQNIKKMGLIKILNYFLQRKI